MKILLIHVYFTKNFQSGVNPIVFNTIEKLKQFQNDVYIFSEKLEPYYVENYNYSKYFPKAAEYWTKDKNLYREFLLYLNFLYNKEAETKLSKMLDEIQPDLVHIHTVLDMSFSILKPIKKRNIPIVYTFHDVGLLCPASNHIGVNYCNKCKNNNILPCIFKRCINNNILKSTLFGFKALTERLLGALKDIDLYLTVSEATRDYAISMNIDKNKIKVLPNFVDNECINKAVPNYSKESKYFLYAGGINKIKGIYTLLKAIKHLPNDIEFHIAGNGNYKEIELFIKENHLNNVKLLGQLNSEQLQKEYQDCISVIMPSECFETFGMINIEAAIYGKPSISSNIGGLPEVVENDKTGLIFEPQNVEQLKECIIKYWNNRDLAIEHGKNAREKVLNEYNEDLYFEKLIKIYKEVTKIHN